MCTINKLACTLQCMHIALMSTTDSTKPTYYPAYQNQYVYIYTHLSACNMQHHTAPYNIQTASHTKAHRTILIIMWLICTPHASQGSPLAPALSPPAMLRCGKMTQRSHCAVVHIVGTTTTSRHFAFVVVVALHTCGSLIFICKRGKAQSEHRTPRLCCDCDHGLSDSRRDNTLVCLV